MGKLDYGRPDNVYEKSTPSMEWLLIPCALLTLIGGLVGVLALETMIGTSTRNGQVSRAFYQRVVCVIAALLALAGCVLAQRSYVRNVAEFRGFVMLLVFLLNLLTLILFGIGTFLI